MDRNNMSSDNALKENEGILSKLLNSRLWVKNLVDASGLGVICLFLAMIVWIVAQISWLLN